MKPAYRSSTQPTAVQRRSVLGAIGAAGVAAAGASLTHSPPHDADALASSPPAPVEPPRGYRLSEHVQRYYHSART